MRSEKKHGNEIVSRFGLGAAQFGMYYGKFNQDGVPSVDAIKRILRAARIEGLSAIDTGHLYGESESVLGICEEETCYFDVTTKTPRFSDEYITENDVILMRAAFYGSLRLMRVGCVNGLLVHHAPNLLAPGGERLYEELFSLREKGLVRRIGFSAYTGELAEEVIQRFPVDFVQLPFNLLDRRLVDSGALQRMVAAGVKIHARSAFLQGLLLADPKKLPVHFDEARQVIGDFQRSALESGITPAQAALHYLLQFPEIEKIFVGVESVRQFDDIFRDFPEESKMNYENFRVDSISILNPVLWIN